MDRQVQKNIFAWRAFHYDDDGYLTPIWYNCIDVNQRASAVTESDWFDTGEGSLRPYYFDLHKWNCSDITPAESVDDEEWIQTMNASRVGLMRATQAGFHSFHQPVDAVAYAEHTHAMVVGKVQVAGRVIEHEHGYRSQFLRIIALYLRNGSKGDSTEVADALGWPFDLQPFSQALKQGRGGEPSIEQGFGGYG